jgi:hypothetical protein
MRKNDFLRVLFTALLVALQLGVYSQIQRQVNYCTITKTFFAIPSCIEEDLLTDLDRIKMMRDDLYACVEDVVSNYRLTTTTYYPQKPRWENDYQYEIGKVVASNQGTYLYDHDGKERSFLPNESTDEEFVFPNNGFIESFGFENMMFDITADKAMYKLSENGFQVYEHEGFVVGITNQFEFAINFTDFIIEMRFFSDGDGTDGERTLMSLHRVEHIQKDGFILPFREIEVTYDTLPSMIPYEITREKSYLSYEVIDESEGVIVRMHNEKAAYGATLQNNKSQNSIGRFEEMQQRKKDLRVFPNPASEQLCVSLPFYMDKEVFITISNTVGQTLFSQHYNVGGQLDIDIHSLPAGSYVIRCTKGNYIVSKLFIKQ